MDRVRSFPSLGFLLLLSLCHVRSDISLVKNGYKGIVVALSPRVQVDDAQAIFASLREFFSNASFDVFNKLEKRAFFEEITLLIPKGLKFQADFVNVSYASKSTYGSAHIVVEPQGVFGRSPYTIQFGPCGTRGLRTVLPLPYVKDSNGDALAEEWLRLRYGVFSTESFPEDPLYSFDRPSKQDVLCGVNARDVVFHSEDFNGSNLAGESQWMPPAFKVVQESPLRFVIVWDIVNVNRSSSPEVKTTQYALRKYATAMAPSDSSGALIYFGDNVLDGDTTLKTMNEEEKKSFAKYFPTTPLSASALPVALEKAKAALEREGISSGTILLITERNITSEEYNEVVATLQGSDISLHVLLLPRYSGDDSLERLAAKFGGKAVSVPMMDEALSLGTQAESIASMLQKSSYSQNLVVLQAEVKDGLQIGEEWEQPIELDVKGAQNLRVGITKKSITSEFENNIQLLSPNNEKTYTSRGKEFKDNNDFFCRWFDIKNPQPGTWTLKISNTNQDDKEQLMIIAKSGLDNHEETIRVNVWTSEASDVYVYGDILPKRLIIYAEVRKGIASVRGAIVKAAVRRPDGDDIQLDLIDNGSGDPDITEGDGIYSRYFTAFSLKGHYTLSVIVKGTDHTQLVLPQSDDDLRCCGSKFPEQPSGLTGSFSRYSQYGSFVTLQDRPEGDIFPPSRITDLVVKKVDSSNMGVTLQWTAPGNDFDSGAAAVYDIRYFDREVQFEAQFETNGTPIDQFNIDGLSARPKQFGQIETATLRNLNCNRTPDSCYFALRARDSRNYGPVSNVVRVTFDEIPVTSANGGGHIEPDTSINDGGELYVENSRGGSRLGLYIGIPVALIILIIILVVIGVCFMGRRKKKVLQQPTTNHTGSHAQDDKTDDGAPTDQNENQYESPSAVYTSISPVNSYSAQYLLERYEEEKKKKANKASTLPKKEDMLASSDDSSDKAHPIWWMPKGPQTPDDLYEEPPAVYATVNKPSKDIQGDMCEQPSVVYATLNRPSKDSSPKRMQTFV